MRKSIRKEVNKIDDLKLTPDMLEEDTLDNSREITEDVFEKLERINKKSSPKKYNRRYES